MKRGNEPKPRREKIMGDALIIVVKNVLRKVRDDSNLEELAENVIKSGVLRMVNCSSR